MPTDTSDKIARREATSATTYFVCTFDNNNNKYNKAEDRDCLINMIEQFGAYSDQMQQRTAAKRESGSDGKRLC